MKNLNPAEHKLKAIIGRYIFPEKIACGLSNCHTPHAKGYIVVTETGHETNIGKDCGKKYFGVDFETLSKQFDDDLEAAQNRELLAIFAFKLDDLEIRIAALRSGDRGADWINRSIRPLLAKGRGCPDEVVQRVCNMVKARNPAIVIDRLATEKEVDALEAVEGRSIRRPHYVSEPAGNLRGLEALFPENDLRNLLVLELEEQLKAFRKIEIHSLTRAALRNWSKWTTSVDSTLDRAVSAIDSGLQLLTARNIGQFQEVLDAPEDRTQLRNYLKSLPP